MESIDISEKACIAVGGGRLGANVWFYGRWTRFCNGLTVLYTQRYKRTYHHMKRTPRPESNSDKPSGMAPSPDCRLSGVAACIPAACGECIS